MIKIWGAATGVLQHRHCIDTDIDIQYISSISSDERYVKTNGGLCSLPPSERQFTLQSINVNWIRLEGDWLVLGSQKVLWLPPDYHATAMAVGDDRIFIGHASGRVSVIVFDLASKDLASAAVEELDWGLEVCKSR